MRRLATLGIAVLWLLSPASGKPRPQASTGNSSRATVEGIVVNGANGQPIEGVHVAMLEGTQVLSEAGIQSLLDKQRPTVQMPQVTSTFPAMVAGGRTLVPERTTHSVITDASGRFAFTEVVPGKYVIAFRADGFSYQMYEQKSDSVFVPPAEIHEGKNNLGSVRMRPEQEVRGRIVDVSGNPIGSMPVYLLKSAPLIGVDGDRRFQVAGETVTDASGSYLIKKIVGGSYLVAVGSSGRSAGIRVSAAPNGGRATEQIPALAPYPYTFYPGVPDIGLALKIDVVPGSNVRVGDTKLAKRELRSIQGRILDSRTGKPPESVRVTLNSWFPFARPGSDSREILGGGKYNVATGGFEFSNLIPGRYRIDAVLPRQQGANRPDSPIFGGELPQQSAFELLELTNSDAKNLFLFVPSGSRVTGKVVVADGKPIQPIPFANSDPIRLQLRLFPLSPLQPAPLATSVSTVDGTFEVGDSLEGSYRFNLLPPLRDNYYVSEARIDGIRAANGILVIPKNVESELIIAVSQGGEIHGTAVDRKGQPVKQAAGLVLPDPIPEVIPFYKTVVADNEGHFSATGIPPGNFRIYLWDGTGESQNFDRELLTRSGSLASPIHLEKGAKISVSVPILAP